MKPNKISFTFNPFTGQLDAISKFNPDSILTHSKNPAGRDLGTFDPELNVYMSEEDQIVTDSEGNIVTS